MELLRTPSDGVVSGNFDLLLNAFDNSDDNLKLLLNLKFFYLMMSKPSSISQRRLNKHFIWALSHDDFIVPRSSLLTEIVMYLDDFWRYDDHLIPFIWKLVKRTGRRTRGVDTTELLNQLLAICELVHDIPLSRKIFNSYQKLGCTPIVQSYLLNASTTCTSLEHVSPWEVSFCYKIRDDGMLSEPWVVAVLILNYCLVHNKTKLAHIIYVSAKDIAPVHAVNLLIRYLLRQDNTVCLAVNMLDELSPQARNNKAATVVFSSVIRGLCRKGDIGAAKKLLTDEKIAKGPPPGVQAFTDIIDSLSKAGDLEGALEMSKLMESRGLKPNVGSYRLIIRGYQRRGLMEQACNVVSLAKVKHPTDKYLTRISSRFGCCRNNSNL